MKSKNSLLTLIAALAMVAVLFQACGNDSGPKELNIESMTVGGADLNAATSPEDVAVDATIEVTFNSDIKAETATSANITLVQDYDDSMIPIDISVEGATLTIDPEIDLGTGALYQLNLTAGLLNSDDQPLAQTSRTFTTTGTFSPPGMIANWTFEGTADDQAGSYNPTANGVVDIEYTASRNSAAGQAATFNGNTSIIEIPNGDDLITTDDFTISFWVKANSDHMNADGNPAGHFVMGLGAHMGLQFEIFGNYDGAKFAIQYEHAEGSAAEDMWFPAEATDANSGGWQGWDYARSLSVEEMQAKLKDNWLHVTYTFNGAERKGILYYDGEIMKSFDFDLWPEGDAKRTVSGMTYAGNEPDVVNELAFGFIHSRAGTMWDQEPWGGYDFPGANHFKGQLDDIKIYHKVLTETEIRLMYESEE
ncbi:Ig-like domain-containing protein [Gracilimonas mengyeensis]|uniref:Concanavalin A-like lectin/glucanases superfamily protein n=1 Tax=Gracilimonas mengyeensis TaxID=1302730 RepID=A0A521BW24_9BACT|nr:Ig-like domain-containing protein [Gracilimonas mengyeensis]SMO51379.1 Concanavalin A-like lectin/glucanases superfamily protein [Gracilimonas mengyeensis]